jgi:WD40 repeat protein
LAFSHGLVASGSRDKTIRLWDPQTWTAVAKLEGHEDEIKSIAFSSDGKRVVSALKNGAAPVWDASAVTN